MTPQEIDKWFDNYEFLIRPYKSEKADKIKELTKLGALVMKMPELLKSNGSFGDVVKLTVQHKNYYKSQTEVVWRVFSWTQYYCPEYNTPEEAFEAALKEK